MSNPIFKEARPSSKIVTIVQELEKLKKRSQVTILSARYFLFFVIVQLRKIWFLINLAQCIPGRCRVFIHEIAS
jgi:hypothetical protein